MSGASAEEYKFKEYKFDHDPRFEQFITAGSSKPDKPIYCGRGEDLKNHPETKDLFPDEKKTLEDKDHLDKKESKSYGLMYFPEIEIPKSRWDQIKRDTQLRQTKSRGGRIDAHLLDAKGNILDHNEFNAAFCRGAVAAKRAVQFISDIKDCDLMRGGGVYTVQEFFWFSDNKYKFYYDHEAKAVVATPPDELPEIKFSNYAKAHFDEETAARRPASGVPSTPIKQALSERWDGMKAWLQETVVSRLKDSQTPLEVPEKLFTTKIKPPAKKDESKDINHSINQALGILREAGVTVTVSGVAKITLRKRLENLTDVKKISEEILKVVYKDEPEYKTWVSSAAGAGVGAGAGSTAREEALEVIRKIIQRKSAPLPPPPEPPQIPPPPEPPVPTAADVDAASRVAPSSLVSAVARTQAGNAAAAATTPAAAASASTSHTPGAAPS